MAQSLQQTRRWKGFVCPECRGVFRIPRDHEGRGVICPACSRVLSLPAAGEESPLVTEPGPEDFEEVASMATAPGAEEALEGAVLKRRRSGLREEEVFDETFADKEEVSSHAVRWMMGAISVCGFIILAALLWPSGEAPTESGSAAPRLAPVIEEEEALVVEAEREVVRPKLVEDQIQPVCEAFLNAESVEEMAQWVSQPQTALPRMKAYYGDDFVRVGFGSILWANHPVRVGNAIRLVLRDRDFDQGIVYAVKEDEGWKIDWEAWVGWSEMTWPQLKTERPTLPVVVRARVSDVNYFNFGFSDEVEWSSYRLSSPDGEEALFGYTPRAGEIDGVLRSRDEARDHPFLLRIRYPEDALSDNQVMVEEILTEGWRLPSDEP